MGKISAEFHKILSLEKGTICCNCKKDCGEEIMFHHIIPTSLGGTENHSNIVPLCSECHKKLHGICNEKGQISHSELTKAGLKKAKEQGKVLGLKPGTKLITKKSLEIKDIILKECKDFGGTLSNAEIIRKTGIAKNTYYKYKREIQENFH